MKQQRRLYCTIAFCLCIVLHLQAQSSLELKFISKVSQKNLQKNVRELVKFGNRLGGTKSGDKAARYVFEKFKSYGFKPQIVKDPKKLVYSNDSWQIKIDQPKRLRGLIQHEWLAGFSPSSHRDTIHLTFVGSIRDIDTRIINGCAVLLERLPSEKLYEELADAGASCILNYQNDISTAYSNWAMISNLKETDKNPIPVFNISNNTGRRLLEELMKGTRIVITYSAKTTIRKANSKTVIAALKGRTDEYYILSAHGDSDSGGPGADDNASGVSGIIELSRIISTMVKNGTLPIPNKSIKFIVWGTEYHSSSSYIKLHAESLDKITGVINLDEIGIGKPRDCIYFEGNDILHNHEILKLFEKVGEDYANKFGFWKEATTVPLQGGTDSFIFLPESLSRFHISRSEIPSITIFTTAWNEPKSMKQTQEWHSKAWKGHPDSVFTNYSPYYHSPLDIPALITDKKPVNMVWGVNVVGIVLIRLLWQ